MLHILYIYIYIYIYIYMYIYIYIYIYVIYKPIDHRRQRFPEKNHNDFISIRVPQELCSREKFIII